MEETKKIVPREELDIVSYLTNPYVRSTVKTLTKSMPCYSPLGKELLEYYRGLVDGYLVDDGALRAFLITKQYADYEIERVLIKKAMYSAVQKEGLNDLVRGFIEFYRKNKILDLVGKFQAEQAYDLVIAEDNLIKAISELNLLSCEYLDLIDLSQIEDPQAILNSEIGDESARLTSMFAVVTNSSAFGAYIKGMLVQVNAPPGIGKTMLMMNECVHMLRNGKKCVWVALGDMIQSDFLIRLTAIIKGVDQVDVIKNLNHYYDDEVRAYFANLRILIYPANHIDASSLANSLISLNDFPYEVFFVDYDANLKKSSDSLYDDGGITYSELARVCRQKDNYKLGFVASQVKPQYWAIEVLPEECSQDSSKKQAVIDMQININLNQTNKDIGTINIPKQRRGLLLFSKFKRHPSGRFLEINYDEYQSVMRSTPSNVNLN